MDKYKLKFTILQQEIFRLLCIRAGDKLNQRELSQLLNVSPTGIAKALNHLTNHISIEHGRHANLTTLKRDQHTLKLKQIENLKQLYDSRLIEYLEDKHPGTTIILFGSYARGEDTTKSDIDIAIIGDEEKASDLSTYDKLLERRININYYSNFNEIHKHLKENLCNGIVLVGGINL